MKRSNQPAYWQLDVFLAVMLALTVVIIVVPLAAWAKGAEIGWAVLTLVGMTTWVRANWAALLREERNERQQRACRRHTRLAVDDRRTIPLTPVQAHVFVMMKSVQQTADTTVTGNTSTPASAEHSA